MNDSLQNTGKAYKKAATILALFIGVLSVFSGSKVLLGIEIKEYTVLTWLVSYNVIFGVLSIFVAYLIWKNKTVNKSFILFILTMHFIAFIYLKFFSDLVAPESIKAMIFRTGIWVVIVVLAILLPDYFNKRQK